MRSIVAVAVFAGVIALAAASCPNSCSGHGRCGEWDECTCFYRWTGPDCSQRLCKEGLAWVDGSQADAHSWAECSNKGICNRDSGECECYPEYEGAACERSVCPNDCSGHGTCEFIQEFSDMTGNEWEYSKIQGCRCDGGFYGTDCSKRLCPRGNDPVTLRNHGAGTHVAVSTELEQYGEIYRLQFEFQDGSGVYEHNDDFYFHLEIEDMWNVTERSRPIKIPASVITGATGAAAFYLDPTHEPLSSFVRALIDMDAIESLDLTLGTLSHQHESPRQQNTGIRTITDTTQAVNLNVVTYYFRLESPLRVHDVRVRYNNECTVPGCYPLMPENVYARESPSALGFPGGTWIDSDLVHYSVPRYTRFKTEAHIRDESEECSSRGVCDYSAGTCTCFTGFYGNACERQTILV